MALADAGFSERKHGMEKDSPTVSTIDDYIAAAPEEAQGKLRTLRATINEIAPEAQETIKYDMPTFVLNGNMVYFALFKKHISLFPAAEAMATKIAGYATYKSGKGTFQLPLDEELPL